VILGLVTVTLSTAVAGLIAGLAIGGLAAGLVLVYRASRVINLAHAELGAAAAALCAWLVGPGGLPVAAATVIAVGAAALTGALVEVVVVRRVGRGSAAAVLIATVGVGELLLALSLVAIAGISRRSGYPVPLRVTLDLARGVTLHGADVALLVLVPGLALVLALVLRWTGLGAAIGAASDNPEAARLAGVPVGALSALAWAAASALAAVVVICLLAGRPLVGSEALGPEVLFEALAAAMVARFEHLPRALAAGVGIGVLEQVVAFNWPGGVALVVLLAVAAGAALVVWRRPGRGSGSGLRGSGLRGSGLRGLGFRGSGSGSRGSDGRPWLAVPVRFSGGPRWVGPAALAAAVVIGVAWASNSQALTLTEIASYATLAISATLIVGVAGQLSLGQVAFFGIGAAVSYQLSVSAGLPFWLAFLGAGMCGAVASILVGVPALRAPGPVFAVTSLGFALVSAGWLLARPWLLGSGVTVPRPIVGPVDLAAQRPYFVFAMVVLGAAAWAAGRLRRGPAGRAMVAVRDNEAAAASFGLFVVGSKVLAFAVAGFLAGVAGAVYGHGLQSVTVNDFPVASPGLQIGAVDSLRIVAIAVIGGLGSVWGAVVAAALVVGVNELTTSVALRLATTGAGLLVVLMVAPEGLAGLFVGWRRR
jgi:ABC-type branched-subunit amino acid transport system permease subunit